jgi:hypothetical protein
VVQQRGPADERPGQGDALALSAAQTHPALAHHGVELLGQVGDEAVGTRQTQRLPHVIVAVRITQDDVLPDGAREEERLLKNHRPSPGGVGDHSGIGPDQPARELNQRALARAGGADDRHDATSWYLDVHVVQHRLGLPRERERDVIEQHADAGGRGGDCGQRVGRDRLVEHLADPVPAGERVGNVGQHVADQPQREDEQREQVHEARQLADGDVAAAHSMGSGHHQSHVGE